MLVNKLKLINFRNHLNLELKFTSTTNIIIGSNGIGKTNILEALFVLATGKSFKSIDEHNLINYTKDFSQISAKINNKKDIDFFLLKRGEKLIKQVKIDKINKKFLDLIGLVKVVLFSPESLQIIIGPPNARRKFMDIVLSQTDIVYVKSLINLKKIILQRNQLLKRIEQKIAKEIELDFWDQKLIESASYIIKKRQEYINFINQYITHYYQQIDHKLTDKIKIKYQSNVRDPERYQDILTAGREKEIYLEKTIFSPHLDELEIKISGRNFREVASRGEIRSLLIGLKMIELDFLEKFSNVNSKPIVLLDDVFSELDKTRRARVINIIENRQSIITATDTESIKDINSDIKIINLEKNNATN